YAFSENSVIAFIELEGLEKYWVIQYVDESGTVKAFSIADLSKVPELQHDQYHGEGAIYITRPYDPNSKMNELNTYSKESAEWAIKKGEAVYIKEGLVGSEKIAEERFKKYGEEHSGWK